MQLVAYGAQDIYLTGNPQITFFKVVYRRHTNFSMESIGQTLNGDTNPSVGGSATCTVSRNGDLVYKVYVQIEGSQPASINYDKLVKRAELEIGGQMIDEQTHEWNQVWNELSTPASKALSLKVMNGCVGSIGPNGSGVEKAQIPLNFWFCRNPGLALPLIALQYHEVKLKLVWGEASSNPAIVYCDYIYLDTDERRRFAQVSHEYLIEQVQHEVQSAISSPWPGANNSFSLNFNHPVKELIWTTIPSHTGNFDHVYNMYDTRLVLNGHERFSKQCEEYFQLKQPFDYHTSVPNQNLPLSAVFEKGFHARDLTGVVALAGLGGRPRVDSYQLHYTDIKDLDGIVLGAILAVRVTTDDATTILDSTTFNFDSTNAATVGRVYYAKITKIETNRVTFERPMQELDGGNRYLKTAEKSGSGSGAIQISVIKPQNARTSNMDNKINVYSFSLKPEEHQPSGTCNFSRIDNAQLNMTLSHTGDSGDPEGNSSVVIYAVNYNVLRIMSGMGGLAYSN